MHPWRTAIAQTDETSIRLCGYDITSLMRHSSFPATVFLLHRGRLPTSDEARLLDAVLIAVADHGAGAPSCAASRLVASGNRQSLSAAVAAGVLAIGDEHGGAGEACMDLIATGLDRARTGSLSLDEAARQLVGETIGDKRRLPGFGHRVHSEIDPRVSVIFGLADDGGLAGDGIRFARALEAALAERVKPIPLNIDGAMAAVLHDLGLPAKVGALLFIVARVAGLSAEVLEELTRERPMRIKIPVTYDGVPPRQNGS